LFLSTNFIFALLLFEDLLKSFTKVNLPASSLFFTKLGFVFFLGTNKKSVESKVMGTFVFEAQ
jgi:hypothetical protein